MIEMWFEYVFDNKCRLTPPLRVGTPHLMFWTSQDLLQRSSFWGNAY